MKSKFYLLLYTLAISISGYSQEIRGRVLVAGTSESLPGASIYAKVAATGTITNKDGNFRLKVSPADTLVVFFVGYKKQSLPVRFPLNQELLIQMEQDISRLKEVTITTGYYEIPPERATGSFTTLDSTQLNQTVSPDLVTRLKGVANGFLIDERSSIDRRFSIRGLSTIYAETQPLIVLNNFPYNGDINSINPNDIESISILKDAAAASIWGVRAANGVIVINTKKGGKGRTSVSFNSAVTIGEEPDMFYRPSISPADYIEAEKFLFQNGFYQSKESDFSHPPLSPVVDLLIAARDGKLSAQEANDQIEQLKQYDVRNDYQKYLYENSLNQQYSLNLKGGTPKSAYYYSLGYDRNSNFTAGKYNRLSFRADNSYQLGKALKLNPVVSFIQTRTEKGRADYNEMMSGDREYLYPYAQLADAEGNPLAVVKQYPSSFIRSAQGLLNWEYVPLKDFNEREKIERNNELLLGMDGSYSITPKLSARLQYQYERSWAGYNDLYKEDSWYARDLVNRYTQLAANGTLILPVPKGSILDQMSSELTSHSGRGQLNYSNIFGKHEISALAGAEVRETKDQSNAYRTYGYDESGLVSTPVNYTTLYQLYTNQWLMEGIPYINNFTGRLNRYTSFYANASWDYSKRYVLSGSIRRDASNLFGVDANKKGVPLWSAGFAWNLHKEDFFKLEKVDQLKLRVTYGYNGNLSRNLSALATLGYVSGNLNNQPYANVRTYPNPDLTWEKIGVLNTALDFSLWNSRLSGSLDYYIKKGRDLIGDQPIDQTLGVQTGLIRRNIADMQTSGIDVQLNSLNVDGAFKWNTSLIWNYNRNKVTAYNSTTKKGSAFVNSGLSTTPVVGRPVNAIYTYRWNGLDPETGDPIGMINGQPSKNWAQIINNSTIDDLEYHGSALPVLFGSLANTFSYKKLSLYVNLTYRLGYYFPRQSIDYTSLAYNWNGHADYAKRWQKPGDEAFTNVPSMVYGADYTRDEFYNNSSILTEKGDHIRIQDINLSWQPGKKLLGHNAFKSLQFYSYLRNPGFIWRATKTGLDPDYTGYLPVTRSISFGLKADF